ncbi:transcription initiation protein [Naasia lichenicola]|uniref:Transcription initiation protein n=1 Tax=Naasia lichenicola TaxID=2565933 RepID=A0A4S4FP91_9MICO|nr:YciI family protein [Naasia lichenicola]THG32078.1 transcription initiation protein [Naasia lichenicola]
MLIMREERELTPEELAGFSFDEILEQMGAYNEKLIAAGVLVTAEGLAPAAEGLVLDFAQTPPIVTDGPYGETKELFNGFWILKTASREEAVEWASQAPLGPGVKLELRRVPSIAEFDIDNEHIQRERAWRESTGQL